MNNILLLKPAEALQGLKDGDMEARSAMPRPVKIGDTVNLYGKTFTATSGGDSEILLQSGDITPVERVALERLIPFGNIHEWRRDFKDASSEPPPPAENKGKTDHQRSINDLPEETEADKG